MNRKERRAAKAQEALQAAGNTGSIFGLLPVSGAGPGRPEGGGGYGLPGSPTAKPATGQTPQVNPFVLPKATGINQISQMFPSSYYVEWNVSSWRAACDQCLNQGYPLSYATLTSWAYESSAFVQMLFAKYGDTIDGTQFFIVDAAGNQIPELTDELCNKQWLMQLRREILFSYFWGFTGINFDPIQEKVYKYPMQQLDPINRVLRENTFSFYDGVRFSDIDTLLFVQPSTNYEAFLGYMQPITRSFIMQNLASLNWLQAGLRLAFPVMAIGYPQGDGAVLPDGTQINPLKLQAEALAANLDPSKALVFPYTMGPDGKTIQKAIDFEFEKTGTGGNAYKIFSEFNDDERNMIRELVLGGTLSSNGSKSGSGSRSLGEVHERNFKQVMKSKLEFVLSILNGPFKDKISKFYKNLPAGWRYEFNRTEQLTLEEMTSLSEVMNQNGKRLTETFFTTMGVSVDYFEDAPAPAQDIKPIPDPDGDAMMALPTSRTNLGVKKKSYW